jgi:Domain of unknown function (DUF6456)
MPRKVRQYNVTKDPRWIKMQAMMDPDVANPLTAMRKQTAVNVGESALTWLYSRGHLSNRQFLAGEKLRFFYERANLGPNVTMNWDTLKTGRLGGSISNEFSVHDHLVSMKDSFDASLLAMGSDLADIAWRVICAGKAITSAEKGLGWPARSGKLVLRIALDRLADHYKMPSGDY